MRVNFIKIKLALLSVLLTFVLSFGTMYAQEVTTGYTVNTPEHLNMNLTARYDVDPQNPLGGLEIVTYNPANQTAYAVDGINNLLIAVPMDAIHSDSIDDLSQKAYKIDLASASEKTNPGFRYGDITSVAVSPDHAHLAVAIQAAAYDATGLVALFPIDNSNDTLGTPTYYSVGVQPDMVIFADNTTLLSADEGEPRMGYLRNLPYLIVRKYCLLSTNYSFSYYSQDIRKAINYIDINLDSPISLKDISDYLGKNASTFSSKFKRETGQTVTEFIRESKIN